MKTRLLTAMLLLCLGRAAAGAAAAAEAPADGAQHGRALWGDGKHVCRELPAPAATRLGMIRQMLAAGKPHAALAYLDAARIEAPQAELLRADGLRQTGRGEQAERIYRKLTGSCVAGYAYQGLGLVASRAGRVGEAVAHLKAASAALPIAPAIRSDYGYALMVAGDQQAALHEFLTAIELAPGNRRAAHNLLLLLARSGDVQRAETFAAQYGIGAEELADIMRLAQQQLPGAIPEQASAPEPDAAPQAAAASGEPGNAVETGGEK